MTFSSLVQLEYNAFEAACVPVAAYTFRNKKTSLSFEAIRLSDFKGINVQEEKTLEAVENKNCGFRFTAYQADFCNIPGSPVAYWLSESFTDNFEKQKISDKYNPKFGMSTGNSEKFIHFWYEVNFKQFDYTSQNSDDAKKKNKSWYAIDKGGTYRKWYGNKNHAVWWKNDGADVKSCKKAAVRSPQLFLHHMFLGP